MKTNKELKKLTQAFGLLTTLHPTMEIDTRDYMGMAKQIEAHVRDLQERVAELEAENERLMEALREIVELYKPTTMSLTAIKMCMVAEQALNEETK